MCESLILALVMPWAQQAPAAQAPLRLDYPALIDGLIDLRWMCEMPRPGEGCDALETQSTGAGLELAHLRGPGVVGRIWCSRAEGTLLVYADGLAEPAATWDLAAFARREESAELPPEPLAGLLGVGWYSVVPFPFQREVRVVWQPGALASAGEVRLQADVRRLGEGVEVPSASAELLRASGADMQRVARTIADGVNPETNEWCNTSQAKVNSKSKVDPAYPYLDGRFSVHVRNSGVLRWMEIWMPKVTNPADIEREMRALTVRLEVGGGKLGDPAQTLLEMPIGEFIGSGFGFNPYDQYLHGLNAEGHFFFRLPIPYDNNLRVTFFHPSKEGVTFIMRLATERMAPDTVPPLRLRGGFLLADAKEAPALDLPGPARLVSYSWSSQSATDDRWDVAAPFAFSEYVSHPRSGAWQQVIHRDGPARFGRSTMLRIFGQDAPMAVAGERLRFAPAANFSGLAGQAQIAARALWYGSADLDGSFGGLYSPEDRKLRPVATPSFHQVPGAMEAEGASIKEVTRGALVRVEDWSARAPAVSRKEVLVLRPAQAGDQLLLEFTPAIGGEYELVACYGRGSELGRVQAYVEGRKAGEAYDASFTTPGLSEEIVLQRSVFLPRAYLIALSSVDGKPVAVDYLRLRPVQ